MSRVSQLVKGHLKKMDKLCLNALIDRTSTSNKEEHSDNSSQFHIIKVKEGKANLRSHLHPTLDEASC